MRLAGVSLTLAAIFLAASSTGGATPLDEGMTVYVVSATDEVAVVAWTGGPEDAEFYRVYGIIGEHVEFLGATPALTAPVSGGYDAYAVVPVIDGAPGDAAYSQTLPCVTFQPHEEPPVSVQNSCTTGGVKGSTGVVLP